MSSKAGADALDGDLIQFFDPTRQGYFTQYYFFTSGGVYGEDYDNKWYDVSDDAEPTLATVPRSEAAGFWYQYRGNAAIELTTSGEVSTNDVEITIEPGFNCIVYPFPADFDFTKLDWKTAGATAGGDALEGDLIQIFDSARQGYFTQYYFFTSKGQYGPDYDDKWYDVSDDSEPTSAKIPAGAGFWYQNRGAAFTITLPSPL